MSLLDGGAWCAARPIFCDGNRGDGRHIIFVGCAVRAKPRTRVPQLAQAARVLLVLHCAWKVSGWQGQWGLAYVMQVRAHGLTAACMQFPGRSSHEVCMCKGARAATARAPAVMSACCARCCTTHLVCAATKFSTATALRACAVHGRGCTVCAAGHHHAHAEGRSCPLGVLNWGQASCDAQVDRSGCSP